jgi:LCP family protein required for cell wall assembly
MSNEGTGRVTPVRRGRHQASPLRGDQPHLPGMPRDPRQEPRARGRFTPAVLDAIFPGLGHFAAGRRRRAVMFALPILALVALALLILATTSLPRLAATLFDPAVLWGLLALQAALLVWRLLAVGSSLWDPRLTPPGRREAVPIAALLLVAVIAPQAYAGFATEVAREAADEIFTEPSPTAAAGPIGTPEPDPSFLATPLPSASASTAPSPTPTVPRVNVLLIGVDAGVGRNTYLTDTMIVASLDPVSETVSMVSIPRDMVDVPLPDGRKFTGKINGLVSYARHHPRQFPGSDGTGFDVLRGALGQLLGLDIRYHAAVNLQGFVNVINKLGGINVYVARSFCDPTYDEYGFTRGFSITEGRHHLNGQQALAYSRVRKPAGESDFTRAARQQEVLSGIRDRMVHGGFINDPIGLLRALSKTITTNVPRKSLPDLADAMSRIGREDTYRSVITSPLVRSGFDKRGSIQLPNLARIEKLSNAVFPDSGKQPHERYLVGKGAGGKATTSGIGGCRPAATPRPTPRPTPKATPKPTPKATATAAPTPNPTAEPTSDPTPVPTPDPT